MQIHGEVKLDRDLTNLLCKSSIFEGLGKEEIDAILPCISQNIRAYGARECVYEKGEEVRDLGVVLEGQLVVCDRDPDGNNSVVASIESNGMFGEMVVFSTSGSMPHRVMAVEGTKVLFLSGDFFIQACGKSCDCRGVHQEVMKNMLRLLSDKAIMLNKKIAYLTAPDLKTKIAMYLCELYEVNQVTTFNMPLNRDRLADFFSVARPSLSRELINLKGQGIIDFYRSTVKIMDLDALFRVANNREKSIEVS